MKADQSSLSMFKLPVKSGTVLADARRRLESVRKLLAAALRRVVGTGERLRATLSDDLDEN